MCSVSLRNACTKALAKAWPPYSSKHLTAVLGNSGDEVLEHLCVATHILAAVLSSLLAAAHS